MFYFLDSNRYRYNDRFLSPGMVSLSIGVFVLWRVRGRSMNTPNFEPEFTLNRYLNQYSTRFNSSDVYTIAFIQIGTAFGAKILSQD